MIHKIWLNCANTLINEEEFDSSILASKEESLSKTHGFGQ